MSFNQESVKNLSLLVGQYVNSAKDSRSNFIANIINICNEQASILPLILASGEYLQENTMVEERKSAILIISQVLDKCHTLQLNEKALSTLIDFLCSRMSHDLLCQTQIILAMTSLYHNYRSQFTQSMLLQFIKCFLNDMDCEKIKLKNMEYNQMARMNSLKLLNNFLNSSLDIIVDDAQLSKNNGFHFFIGGCMRLMENENDPRNILMSFTLFRSIFQLLPYSILLSANNVQNMFDIIDVYFPIEFNAPSVNGRKDLFGITKVELQNSLHECFVCHELLQEPVFKSIFEKLNEELQELQTSQEQNTEESAHQISMIVDIVQCLDYCCSKFSLESIEKYLSQLYSIIKKIVLYCDEQLIVDHTLKLLSNICGMICINIDMDDINNDYNDNNNVTDVNPFIGMLIKDYSSELSIPDSKLALQCSKMLISATSANYNSFLVIFHCLWKPILDKFNIANIDKLPAQKHALLNLMSSMIVNHTEYPFNSFIIQQFYQLFMSVLRETSDVDLEPEMMNDKCISMVTLSFVCSLELHSLNETEIEDFLILVFQQFEKYFLSNNHQSSNSNLNIYLEIICSSMKKISIMNTEMVIKQFVQPIITYIEMKNIHDIHRIIKYVSLLQCSYISNYYLLQKISIPLLICIKKLPFVITSQIYEQSANDESEYHWLQMCFSMMANNIEPQSNCIVVDVCLIRQLLTELLMNITFECKNSTDIQMTNELCPMISYFISRSLMKCKKISEHFLSLSVNHIKNEAQNQYSLLLHLTTIVSCADIHTNATLNSIQFLCNLQTLLFNSFIQRNMNLIVLNYCLECIACIVHHMLISNENVDGLPLKMIAEKYLMSDYFQIQILKYIEEQSNMINDENIKLRTIFCASYAVWICKSLITMNSSLMSVIVNQIQNDLIAFLCGNLCSDNMLIAHVIAVGFESIVNDCQLVFHKQNVNTNISIFYRQKFFNQAMEHILEIVGSNNISNNDNVQRYPIKNINGALLAVSHLMKSLPNSVLSAHLPLLMPLMMRCLSTNAKTSQNLSIETLFALEKMLLNSMNCESDIHSANAIHSAIGTYMDTIVPALLLFCENPQMNVRLSALKCLLLFCTDEKTNLWLVPMKHKICRKSSMVVLNDSKRKVRELAVQLLGRLKSN